MRKVFVVLLIAVLATAAFAGPYTFDSAPICGNNSGTDDTTFVNAPNFGLPYGVAVAGNGRAWVSSYYDSGYRYRQAIMVWDPEFALVDTVGPEISYDGAADTIGLCRFMQTLDNGDVAYGDWTNDRITVFDQEDYSVTLRSDPDNPCNNGGGIDAFFYNGEQYYVSQQIVGSEVVLWDSGLFPIDTLEGGAGGRNIACTRDGSIIISPSLGGNYFIEFAGNPDDGYVQDSVFLEDISVDLGNLMYVSSGPNDYIWLMSRDAANDGIYVVDPADAYATKMYTNTDSTIASIDDMPMGMAVDNQWAIWLEEGSIDSSDVYTTLGYHQPYILRSPCQVAYDFDGPSATEYLYMADFYGWTLKLWTRETETAVWENTGVIGENAFRLKAAYPNPFNPSTTIPYDLHADANVSIEVFDIAGKKVQTLVNEYKYAGTHEVTFNANDLASGNYLLKMTVGNESVTQKVALLK